MKTSKEDFELFKTECWKWIRFFGLTNWQISFIHINSQTDHQAWIEDDLADKSVMFLLNRNWIDDKSFYCKNEIKVLAFHEVCELLLTKLDDYAKDRFGVIEKDINGARHEIIHSLENSVYEKLKSEV
jgi:hypothetical protein